MYLFMCVCMYVCIFLCVYVCMYVCMYVYMFVWNSYIHAYTHTHHHVPISGSELCHITPLKIPYSQNPPKPETQIFGTDSNATRISSWIYRHSDDDVSRHVSKSSSRKSIHYSFIFDTLSKGTTVKWSVWQTLNGLCVRVCVCVCVRACVCDDLDIPQMTQVSRGDLMTWDVTWQSDLMMWCDCLTRQTWWRLTSLPWRTRDTSMTRWLDDVRRDVTVWRDDMTWLFDLMTWRDCLTSQSWWSLTSLTWHTHDTSMTRWLDDGRLSDLMTWRDSLTCHIHDTSMTSITFPTENTIPPQSTKSKNSDSSVSRGTNSHWDFGLIWICTEKFEFLDLVGFGSVVLPSALTLQPKVIL